MGTYRDLRGICRDYIGAIWGLDGDYLTGR